VICFVEIHFNRIESNFCGSRTKCEVLQLLYVNTSTATNALTCECVFDVYKNCNEGSCRSITHQNAVTQWASVTLGNNANHVTSLSV